MLACEQKLQYIWKRVLFLLKVKAIKVSVYNLWILYVARKINHTGSQNLLDKESVTNICFLLLWSVLP